MRVWLLLMTVLAACGGPPPELLDNAPCRDPQLYKPVGDTADPNAVYFGCRPPEGWVTRGSDTGGAGGSGTTGGTGGTGGSGT